ncbi:hypothetical protein DFP73DRAFT_525732 [Morchella snyderi]|nr:hypothetical protein DFP73DRAFT_525732 [Morchella snyderi]
MSVPSMQDSFLDYFKSPPQSWNIDSFLKMSMDHASSLGQRYDYEPTHAAWNKNIRTLLHDSDPERSKRAGMLLRRWTQMGSGSDKARAKRFHNKARSSSSRGSLIVHRNRIRHFTNNGKIYGGSNIKLKKPASKRAATPENNNGSTEPSPRPSPTPEDPVDNADFTSLGDLESSSKLLLSDGDYVEDIVLRYARSITSLDLSHWRIIDSADVEIRAILHRHNWESLPELNEDVPRCPSWFLSRCDEYQTLRHITACETIASLPPTNDADPLTIRWVDRAYEHVMNLLAHSHNLLSRPLGEGAWEGIYWVIIDRAFTNSPDLWLQRRDTTLQAISQDITPLVLTAYRYDGVIRASQLSYLSKPLEFGVIEVSKRWEGDSASKWNNDMAKLYVGCRAMLNGLKAAVNHDPNVMTKLAVVGIIQAGPNTVVMIMRFIGPNLYTLRRGARHSLPKDMENIHSLQNVLASIWIARVWSPHKLPLYVV